MFEFIDNYIVKNYIPMSVVVYVFILMDLNKLNKKLDKLDSDLKEIKSYTNEQKRIFDRKVELERSGRLY